MDRDKLQIDLEYVTQKRAFSEGENLISVLARLDAVAEEEGLPAKLEHYLKRRSYEKALNWIVDPSTPHVQ